jgi:hypothetical protein
VKGNNSEDFLIVEATSLSNPLVSFLIISASLVIDLWLSSLSLATTMDNLHAVVIILPVSGYSLISKSLGRPWKFLPSAKLFYYCILIYSANSERA